MRTIPEILNDLPPIFDHLMDGTGEMTLNADEDCPEFSAELIHPTQQTSPNRYLNQLI